MVAKAAKTGLAPTIGIDVPRTTVLDSILPDTAAAHTQPELKDGDRIVAVDGTPVSSYAELFRYLAGHPDATLKLTVERPQKPDGPEKAEAKPQELTVSVPPAPLQTVGLVMQMGPIVAIQAGSPAAEAHLQEGDLIQEVNGPAGRRSNDAAGTPAAACADREIGPSQAPAAQTGAAAGGRRAATAGD